MTQRLRASLERDGASLVTGGAQLRRARDLDPPDLRPRVGRQLQRGVHRLGVRRQTSKASTVVGELRRLVGSQVKLHVASLARSDS